MVVATRWSGQVYFLCLCKESIKESTAVPIYRDGVYKPYCIGHFVLCNKQDGMSSFGCTPNAEWVLKINYARGLCGRP